MTLAGITRAIRRWFRRPQSRNWFPEFVRADRRIQRLQRILTSELTPKELARAQHMADLEHRNKQLRREVRMMQEKAEVFNDQLYATGLIVNCTGCWAGRPDNAESLTEERVRQVENIADRVRRWWEGEKHRRKRDA